jgi:hypothetical protein
MSHDHPECPRCGRRMDAGYVVDRTSGPMGEMPWRQQARWVAGAPERDIGGKRERGNGKRETATVAGVNLQLPGAEIQTRAFRPE